MPEDLVNHAVDSKEYSRLKAENHRLRQELREAGRGFAPATIIGMRDIVLVIGPAGEITYANSPAESHFGVPRDRLLGSALASLASIDLEGAALMRLVQDP